MSDLPKGKGKLVEDDVQGRNGSKTTDNESGLGSRIAQSAAGLAKDIVNTNSGRSITSSLASSETLGSKSAAAARPNAPAWIQDSTLQNTREMPAPSSFRGASASQQEQALESEADFAAFLDSTAAQSFEEPNISAQEFHAMGYGSHSAGSTVATGHVQGYKQAEVADGAAVLGLLNNPDMNDLVDTAFESDPNPLYEPSPSEIGKGAGITNPQNLLPDAVNTLSAIPPSGPQSDHDEVRFGLLKEQEQWVADWEGVLKNYMRDVWTDLEPLIIEAKRELQNKEEQKPALSQLGHRLHELKSKL